MGFCDLPGMNVICAVTGTSSITDSIGQWIAKSAGDLAESAVELVNRAVNSTTAVDLNASWFRHNYELLLPIGLVLTVGTFVLQLLRAAWQRDGGALWRAVSGTVTGIFFAFSAISLTTVALTIVDALSAGLFTVAGTSISDAVRRVMEVSELGVMDQLGWAIPAVVALGCAVGAFLYWGVMLFRKVGILILVTLAVFVGASGGWEAARRWRRGWIEATATLVFSKLLMTVVFLIGVSAIGQADAKDGLSALADMLAGCVVMVLVLLCPFATYKFVHWATESGGSEELHRTGAAGVKVAAGAAQTAGSLAMRSASGGAAPQGPNKVPGMGSNGVATGIDPTGGTNVRPTQNTPASSTSTDETASDRTNGSPASPAARTVSAPTEQPSPPGSAAPAAEAPAGAPVGPQARGPVIQMSVLTAPLPQHRSSAAPPAPLPQGDEGPAL